MDTPIFIPGIFFAVRGDAARALAAWRYETDSRIIRAHLQKRGFALVNNLITGQHMQRITEMPPPGTATPHIGMTGGGFTYHFTVRDGQVKLTAECYSTGFPPIPVDDLTPHHANLPDQPWAQAPLQPGVTLAYPEDTLRLQDAYLFGFGGDFLKIFHRWTWYSEDLELFDFAFSPSSIGCTVLITHLPGGETLDLTADVDW